MGGRRSLPSPQPGADHRILRRPGATPTRASCQCHNGGPTRTRSALPATWTLSAAWPASGACPRSGPWPRVPSRLLRDRLIRGGWGPGTRGPRPPAPVSHRYRGKPLCGLGVTGAGRLAGRPALLELEPFHHLHGSHRRPVQWFPRFSPVRPDRDVPPRAPSGRHVTP